MCMLGAREISRVTCVSTVCIDEQIDHRPELEREQPRLARCEVHCRCPEGVRMLLSHAYERSTSRVPTMTCQSSGLY